jgi:hypothetical protein
MANQLYEDGNAITVNGNELECVSVSYAEENGEKQNFVYSFRLKSEIDAERAAAAQIEADRQAQEAEQAAQAAPAAENQTNTAGETV